MFLRRPFVRIRRNLGLGRQRFWPTGIDKEKWKLECDGMERTNNLGAANMETPVIIPTLPSLPINICFKSNPVLSFRSVFNAFKTRPSGRTTSSPKTVPLKDP